MKRPPPSCSRTREIRWSTYKGGRCIRPALGIEVDEGLNRRLTAATGTKGVFELRVTPGSAAEQAGLAGVHAAPQGIEPSDVIITVEGKAVDSVSKLLAYLDDFQVGNTVGLGVKRGDTTREVAATLQPGM